MTVSLAAVTHSGWLRLAVNGVEATNNINNNALTPNKEDDGSGLGSTLWSDDRYLRVWAVGATFNQSASPEHPSMSITSTGTLYGAWTNNAGSSGYYATTAARTTFHYKFDPPVYTDLVIDAADNLNIGFLANYFNGVDQWGFVSRLDRQRAQPEQRGTHYDGYVFEWLGNDDMLFQFQRPRVVRSGNNIHLAYYDVNTKTLKYGYVPSTDTSLAEQLGHRPVRGEPRAAPEPGRRRGLAGGRRPDRHAHLARGGIPGDRRGRGRLPGDPVLRQRQPDPQAGLVDLGDAHGLHQLADPDRVPRPAIPTGPTRASTSR